MKIEDLKTFNVSDRALEVNSPGKTGFSPRLTQCVLLSDLPQKIAVGDRMPKEFETVIIYTEDKESAKCGLSPDGPHIGYWDIEEGWWRMCIDGSEKISASDYFVTHWREILW